MQNKYLEISCNDPHPQSMDRDVSANLYKSNPLFGPQTVFISADDKYVRVEDGLGYETILSCDVQLYLDHH